MKILDPGHKYSLNSLDGQKEIILQFVKREGEKFPGNIGSYPGTTTQEVCRALIDRLVYVNNQIPHKYNSICIFLFQTIIYLLEKRAAERHNRKLNFFSNIESIPTCITCGHIECKETHSLK